MARDRNNVRLKGHVGKEPDIRVLDTGQTVINFNLATNRNYRHTDQITGEISWTRRTEWHHITAWNKLAQECAKQVHKGTRVELEGSIHSVEWKAPDGRTITLTEILANQVDIMAPISSLKNEEEAEEEFPEEILLSTVHDFNPTTLPEEAIAS